MARHGFGRGEYKYFSYPVPGIIQGLRTALYRELTLVANQWNQHMGIGVQYSSEHADFNVAMTWTVAPDTVSASVRPRVTTTVCIRISMGACVSDSGCIPPF
jgi:hypothetical protein